MDHDYIQSSNYKEKQIYSKFKWKREITREIIQLLSKLYFLYIFLLFRRDFTKRWLQWGWGEERLRGRETALPISLQVSPVWFFLGCLQSDVFCVPSPIFLTAPNPHPVPRSAAVTTAYTRVAWQHITSAAPGLSSSVPGCTPCGACPGMWVQALWSLRESASPGTTAPD